MMLYLKDRDSVSGKRFVVRENLEDASRNYKGYLALAVDGEETMLPTPWTMKPKRLQSPSVGLNTYGTCRGISVTLETRKRVCVDVVSVLPRGRSVIVDCK
jgi:hypothetical protein